MHVSIPIICFNCFKGLKIRVLEVKFINKVNKKSYSILENYTKINKKLLLGEKEIHSDSKHLLIFK